MEKKMFCFQCQETAMGTGCTVRGVCGKKATTAVKMDMLLFATRGISVVNTALRDADVKIPSEVNHFVTDALFTTITNANFDDDAILLKIQKGFEIRMKMLDLARQNGVNVPAVDEVTWLGPTVAYEMKANHVGVLRNADVDIRSLKELITYGLKGIAAYVEHARNLGFEDPTLDCFIQRALSDITAKRLSVDELLGLVLATGENGVNAMALLDKANTTAFGHPEATIVETGVGRRPGILVTGHDLCDLEMLLKQTVNEGVDVYTHGEMLPAHYYPMLNKYYHLKGNYGSSWWHQREEFETFNGPILFTTNCLVPPTENAGYRHRIFTTNSAGFPGCQHILANKSGYKDFSAIIETAKTCEPPTKISGGSLLGGFAHHQMSLLAEDIMKAIQDGRIRKFYVMAGCDGRMRSREYYTEFAKALPHDTVILTAGCAKYRYNSLGLGDIDGIPRVLDAGQCNDSYSLVLTAITLRDMLGLKDVNELPIVYNIAWYEQKAVIVLLALLSLNVRNIHLGPTLPAFLSPNVLKVLVDKFGVSNVLPNQ